MSKRKDSPVLQTIEELLTGTGSVSAGQVAREAGVTRQAAHYHLRRLTEQGRLRRIGAGRSARYVPVFDIERTYPIPGLSEDLAWRDVVAAVPELSSSDAALRVNRFAFTEMVNNANEHSGGDSVEIGVATTPKSWFRVVDDGVGVFRHFASRLGLPDEAAAAFELTKGKRTTAPDEHSGEGIFFTSRLVNRFGLEANGIRLIVDNDLGDFAIGGSVPTAQANGIVRPGSDSGSLELDDIPKRYAVKVNDVVSTSGWRDEKEGFGSRLPQGIPIGVVTQVNDPGDALVKVIQVTPLVDLDAFSHVLVLTARGAAP